MGDYCAVQHRHETERPSRQESEMAEFKNPFLEMDVQKLMGEFKLPNVDVDAVVAAQKQNIEALTSAHHPAVAGMQANHQPPTEMLRHTVAGPQTQQVTPKDT